MGFLFAKFCTHSGGDDDGEGCVDDNGDAQLKSKAQLKVWDRVVEKLKTDGARIAQYDGKSLVTSAGPCFVESLTDAPIK